MKRNKNCTFAIEQEKQICADYDNGLSCVRLAKKWGSNTSSIHKILKVYKVKMRTLSEARNNFVGRKLNTSIFSEINSKEKAYWLGVFYADGYISKANPYTNYFGIPYHILPDKTIYSLAYNVKESEYLEKRLYKNAPVYLKRKFEIAKRSFNSPLTLEDVRKNSE